MIQAKHFERSVVFCTKIPQARLTHRGIMEQEYNCDPQTLWGTWSNDEIFYQSLKFHIQLFVAATWKISHSTKSCKATSTFRVHYFNFILSSSLPPSSFKPNTLRAKFKNLCSKWYQMFFGQNVLEECQEIFLCLTRGRKRAKWKLKWPTLTSN